jgi:hypothetical protein
LKPIKTGACPYERARARSTNLRDDCRNFGGGGVFFGVTQTLINMKTNILAITSVLAAFAVLPLSTAAAGILFVAIGILAVFAADYGRTLAPMSVRAEIVPFDSNEHAANCAGVAA